jgi:uncharacterized protein (TIGR02453 family)
MSTIPKEVFSFLNRLKNNNHRNWFDAHKSEFKQIDDALKEFYTFVVEDLNVSDTIDKMKIFRIYRDVRFSKDKTPYNTHRSVSFSRATESLRGGYYLKIAPGESRMAGGFFQPNPVDLKRIRKEFETDDQEIREIINDSTFTKMFVSLEGDEVKTAPRGFDIEHPAIDLIRKKSFLAVRRFTDEEVLSANFRQELKESYLALRPFFDYMSAVLTTDLNGVSLRKDA